MKPWEKHLASIYYDPKEPASFTSSIDKIKKVIKAKNKFVISNARIRKWLAAQDVATANRQVRRKFTRPRVIVDGMNELWDADLMDMQDSKDDNDGKRYVLVVIDVFSKKTDAEAIDSKQPKDVIEALSKIFTRSTKTIRKLRTDRGTEFVNRKMAAFLKGQNIMHQITTNEPKANFAERFIKTLKKKITRFFLHRLNFRYVDELPNFISSYNNTYHRSIEMKPSEVNSKNEDSVYETLYVYPYWKNLEKQRLKNVKNVKNEVKQIESNKAIKNTKRYKLKVGDIVKLSFNRQPFDREYYQRWTSEIFTITARQRLDNIPMYTVKDYSGEMIKGMFYESELQKVIFNEDDAFKIDTILKTRKRGKESLISWVGWPKKYNQWIKTKEIHLL